MAGCWEIQNQNQVLTGILHVDQTTIAWALGLRNLILPGPIMPVSGMPFDHSRNTCAMRALEIGAKFLFFLDSDVIPPRDAVLRLMSHNLPIVSGIYCRRSHPAGVPVMIRNGQWVTEYPQNSLIEVDLVGAGCLLVRRDVLEKMPPQRPEAGKHWFDWKVDAKGKLPAGECLSEDFTFCQWAKKILGVRTIVDTSVNCLHIGNSQVSYGRMEPCEANPNT